MICEGNEGAESKCRYLHLKAEEPPPDLASPQRTEGHGKRLILQGH